jgi:predicted RNA-binding protein with PUA-like domain
MAYWLMKSEPADVSIDDLASMKKQTVPWYGVRNYLARNYMRDLMQLDDGVLFYHSSCAQPGIAGLARVASKPYPDATQFDPKSKYFDPKSTPEKPRWMHVDVQLVKKINLISLVQLRQIPNLEDMIILQKGNRLSITPVTVPQWQTLQQFVTTFS